MVEDKKKKKDKNEEKDRVSIINEIAKGN